MIHVHSDPLLSVSTPGWAAALAARLERAFAPVGNEARPEPRAPVVPPTGPRPCGLRVLVVDDNPSHLGDARDLLRGWGITPMLAADGAEAVALAGAHAFDLILMDLQMPVLDGLAATRQIRVVEQQQFRARAPVLAYTTRALEADVLRSCGLDGLLMKPCCPQALQEGLVRWCAPRTGSDVESTAPADAPWQR